MRKWIVLTGNVADETVDVAALQLFKWPREENAGASFIRIPSNSFNIELDSS